MVRCANDNVTAFNGMKQRVSYSNPKLSEECVEFTPFQIADKTTTRVAFEFDK